MPGFHAGSPGPGRPPVPARSPFPRGRRAAASPRDAGVGSCPPVGGQRQRGMRQGQRQQSGRNRAGAAGRSGGSAAGAAPGRGPGGWGRAPGPLRPRRQRLWPCLPGPGRAPAGAEPAARSRSSASPREWGCRAWGPPGEPQRSYGIVPAPAGLSCAAACVPGPVRTDVTFKD